MNKEIIITGQQKIMFDKYKKGILKATYFYSILASMVNEIPNSDNISDHEAIMYIINHSKVKTNPHKSINFYSRLNKSRHENRKALKKAGVIS